MKGEILVSKDAANAVCGLIHEYRKEGGTGFDHHALLEFQNALMSADRIIRD